MTDTMYILVFDSYISVNAHIVEPILSIKQNTVKEKITLTWPQLSSITRLFPSGILNVKSTRTFSRPARWSLLPADRRLSKSFLCIYCIAAFHGDSRAIKQP